MMAEPIDPQDVRIQFVWVMEEPGRATLQAHLDYRGGRYARAFSMPLSEPVPITGLHISPTGLWFLPGVEVQRQPTPPGWWPEPSKMIPLGSHDRDEKP
jgi:hypothetical protein